MALNFINNLNIEVDAYLKYKKPQDGNVRRGINLGGITGEPISRVGKDGDELQIHLPDNIKEFELHIEMDEIPLKDEVKGVKVIPGSGLGSAHHIEFHESDDHYLAVIHYKHSGRGPEIHVDPEVSHPEPPNP